MTRALVALLAACGSSAPPAVEPADRRPPPVRATVPPLPPPAPVSCRDASVILRAPLDDESAARALMAAIEETCETAGWSREVLDCIGDKPTGHAACLDQLTPAQRAEYDARIVATSPAKPIDCTSGLGRVDLYDPKPTSTGYDRVIVDKLRQRAVEERCNADGWERPSLECFDGGRDPADCRALLSRAQDQAITAALTAIDAFEIKLVAIQKKPAQISCKAIAAGRYTDKAFAAAARGMPARARKHALDELRTWMVRSCTSEGWSSSVRGCAVVGDLAACMDAFGMTARWDFTPLSDTTNVAECDAFAKTISSALRCPAVEVRDTRDVFDEARARIAAGNPTDASELCVDEHDVLRDAMKAASCKP